MPLCLGAAGNLQGVAFWDNAKSAQSVAQHGYKAMMHGELVAFNEGKLRFMLDWIIPCYHVAWY
ncbi:TPA: hypothetical protein ACFP3W_002158 [Neisseria subflava]